MVPGASSHCPRQAPVLPLILVITDVDTPPVHCQRHIYVYHFVYLRPTQAAHEYSIGVAFRGPGGSLLSFGIVTVPAQAQSTLVLKPISQPTCAAQPKLRSLRCCGIVLVLLY